MTYTIFTLLYTVVSGAIFLSCFMIALFRRKPPMFMYAYSFACSTVSTLVLALQTTGNLIATVVAGHAFFLASNILLYQGTRLFYEGSGARWPKRFWGYLGFGTAVVIFFTVARYDIIARTTFMALFTSAIFADFAYYLRRHYIKMPTPIRAAFAAALAVTEASYVGRIMIVMSMRQVPDLTSRTDDLNIYILASYVVSAIFWLTTLILLDDSRMMAELEQENRILEPMAHTDNLTGLDNRNKLSEVVAGYISLTSRLNQPLTFILIDIDHFKAINDTFGHAVGDQTLVRLAEILRRNVRATDRVFRWGGEEFLILAVGTPADGGLTLAENLRQKVTATLFPEVGLVTASFGVAEQLPDETFENWFRRADQALYQAKHAGRNRAVKWDDGERPGGGPGNSGPGGGPGHGLGNSGLPDRREALAGKNASA